MKPTYTIKNWIITDINGLRLIGESSRYEGYTGKDFIRTSRIIGKRNNTIETKNSIYELGEVARDYDKTEMLKGIPEL